MRGEETDRILGYGAEEEEEEEEEEEDDGLG